MKFFVSTQQVGLEGLQILCDEIRDLPYPTINSEVLKVTLFIKYSIDELSSDALEQFQRHLMRAFGTDVPFSFIGVPGLADKAELAAAVQLGERRRFKEFNHTPVESAFLAPAEDPFASSQGADENQQHPCDTEAEEPHALITPVSCSEDGRLFFPLILPSAHLGDRGTLVQAEDVLSRLNHTLEHYGSSLDQTLEMIFFFKDFSHFPATNDTINKYIARAPARSSVQVPYLPGNVAFGIECIAQTTANPSAKRRVSAQLTKPLPLYSHSVTHRAGMALSAIQGFLPNSDPEAPPKYLLPTLLEDEVGQALFNAQVALSDAGRSLDDVTSMTFFATDVLRFQSAINEVVERHVFSNKIQKTIVGVDVLPRLCRIAIVCEI